MDPRVTLLKEFYRGLPRDHAKLETNGHGFGFLDALLAGGAELEYGELTLSGLLHKYKLAHIPESRMDAFLHSHVEKDCNVCLYFDGSANQTFCFNLDNNNRENNREMLPEMETAVRLLRKNLGRHGCEPLVVASGRGYHVWGRLDGPVPNGRLYKFMLHAAVATVAEIHAQGQDHHRIKFNFYPDPRVQDVVSLRLFGSLHARNRVFSHILGPEGPLDESASWEYFATHLRTRAYPVASFDAALAGISTLDT